MPLLIAPRQDDGDGGGPGPGPDQPGDVVHGTWTDPNGGVLDLSCHRVGHGVWMMPGATGLFAAPRAVTREALAAGGTYGRWSHVDERLVVLPVGIVAPSSEQLRELRRNVVRRFTATTPAAAPPRPGTLRYTYADGSWRELHAVYVEGLGGHDEGRYRRRYHLPVITLVCPDPWWYGPEEVAIAWRAETEARDYLDPYETVSPHARLGTREITVAGDAPASPVWQITGPATTVTAGLVTASDDGPSWSLAPVEAGEVIRIDTAAWTVTNQDGQNRISRLDWGGGSTLWQLPAGEVRVHVDMTGTSPTDPPSGVRLTYRPGWETQ